MVNPRVKVWLPFMVVIVILFCFTACSQMASHSTVIADGSGDTHKNVERHDGATIYDHHGNVSNEDDNNVRNIDGKLADGESGTLISSAVSTTAPETAGGAASETASGPAGGPASEAIPETAEELSSGTIPGTAEGSSSDDAGRSTRHVTDEIANEAANKPNDNTSTTADSMTESPQVLENAVLLSIVGPAETGVILEETVIELKKADTVLEVLKRATRAHKIHMEYRGSKSLAYIEGIDNIYEFDHGAMSGWVFVVNGEPSNKSAGTYAVSAGDRIQWVYSLELGQDVGSSAANGDEKGD